MYLSASDQLIQILTAAADKMGENIRPIAEAVGGYAESGPTFDESGDYLCGTCQLRLEPNQCATVKGPISMTAGSCYQYIKGEQKFQKPFEHQFDQDKAGYSERPNLKGFGCKRCEYVQDADVKDSEGRDKFCKFWGMTVIPNACCFRNSSEDDKWAPGEENG